VPEITSRHHRVVRAFKSAARREGEFALLDGWHLLHEAAATLEIAIVAVAGAPSREADVRLLEQVARRCDVVTVTAPVMNAISPVRTPSGVVALARPLTPTLHALLQPTPALVVVAVDVQDPGNTGAIVRSAEAGGASGVLLLGNSADAWSWKALRAAMGSTFRMPVVRSTDSIGALAALRQAGLVVHASVPRGGVSMHETPLHCAVALIVGAEGAGLDDQILAQADARISIPMTHSVDSLNVAVAAALLVYEARRQRANEDTGHVAL
jgi:TrmH family RNA methyltransferase